MIFEHMQERRRGEGGEGGEGREGTPTPQRKSKGYRNQSSTSEEGLNYCKLFSQSSLKSSDLLSQLAVELDHVQTLDGLDDHVDEVVPGGLLLLVLDDLLGFQGFRGAF